MKTLLALILLSVASASFASDSCTFSIKDRYGYEYETHTRISYNQQAACSDADYACRVAISDGQRNGRYMDAYCEQKSVITPNRPPLPPTSTTMCSTDLVDYYGGIVRSFTGYGQTQWEACNQSEQFCNYELSRDTSRGYRCVTRNGNGYPNPYPQPRPPRDQTETCKASRFDPAGYYIESYIQSYTGPYGSDVKGEACRRAYQQCNYEIRGRQTCRIEG